MKEIVLFVLITVLSAFVGGWLGSEAMSLTGRGEKDKALDACYSRYYNLIYSKPIAFTVSAYTTRPEETAPWADGKTATGLELKDEHRWKIVACDWNFWKPGQKFLLLGNGVSYWAECQDSGGKIRGRDRLDIFVGDLREARKFGIRRLIGVPLSKREVETNAEGKTAKDSLSRVRENVC